MMLKKIIALGIFLVTVFTFAAFTFAARGDISDLQKQIEQQDDRISQLEQRLSDAEFAQYKTDARAQIQDYADDKAQIDYTDENWMILLQAVQDGKAAVGVAETRQEADAAVEEAKQAIDAIESGKLTNFVLTTTADKTTVERGQKFVAYAVLEYKGKVSQELATYGIYFLHIEGWAYYIESAVPPKPYAVLLEKGDTMTTFRTYWVELKQEPGNYELLSVITLYKNYGLENEESLTIASNTVNITVQ